MRKRYWKRIISAGLTAGIMATSLAGCGSGSSSAEDESGIVTLNVLTAAIASPLSEYPDTHVMEAMAEEIGVKLNVIEADDDKYNVYTASGDGFDLILTDTDRFDQLIQGEIVMPLDDMLEEYGQDITANIPDAVQLRKDNWSNDEGKLYFLPCQIGVDSQGISQSMGPITRWDYYKEMGYPEIGSLEEWMDMLEEMQKAHPETEDGLPVYGVSMFSDWGTWCYKFPMACYLGYNELSGATALYKPSTMEYSNLFAEDGLFWASMDYYFQANQRGLLDPDAFINKYDDYTAKGSNGQLLTGPSIGSLGTFNSSHAGEAVGFEAIPTTWSNQWGNTNYTVGWPNKYFGINSKCEYPEKAMAFLNYIYSYDGCRLLYSGVEGEDYTIEDGIPTPTEENIEMYKEQGTAWKETGLGFDRNIVGLGNYTIDPDDGKTLDLFCDPSLYPELLTTCQQDFCEHYGVTYPDEIFQQYREQYDVYDQSGTNSYAIALMPAAPDEITRMEANMVEFATAQASTIILAEDEATFDQLKKEAIAEFNDMGLQEVTDWYSTEWENAKIEAENYS